MQGSDGVDGLSRSLARGLRGCPLPVRAGGEMSAHRGAGVGRGPQAGGQQVSKVSAPGSQEWVAGVAGTGQTAANTSRTRHPPVAPTLQEKGREPLGHGSSRRGTCTAGGHLRWERRPPGERAGDKCP